MGEMINWSILLADIAAVNCIKFVICTTVIYSSMSFVSRMSRISKVIRLLRIFNSNRRVSENNNGR